MKIKFGATLVLMTLFTLGCGFLDKGGDEIQYKGDDQLGPQYVSGDLVSFASCEKTEEHIEDQVATYLRRQADNQIRLLLKYRKNDVAESQSDSTGGESLKPSNYTTTNNQVAGVEESDFVKNTGTHIYQLAGQNLRILKSWPANDLKEIAKVEFDTLPFEMLLNTERHELVVIGRSKHQDKGFHHDRLKVHVVDVADPSQPKVLEFYKINGHFITARQIGDSVKIITNVNSPLPGDMGWYNIDYDASKKSQLKSILAQRDKNIETVRSQSLNFWLDLADDDDVLKQNCAFVYAPKDPVAEVGRTSITTINLAKKDVKRSFILSRVQDVYASKDSLYMTTPFWWWDNRDRNTNFTYIHKFRLDDEYAYYRGTAGVDGSVLNQFSMDEHEDNLRVATTVIKWSKQGQSSSFNRVLVLAEDSGKFDVIGKTEKLAEGEQIYSARFSGDRGYVVTFRQVDPLFTLDLRNPRKPKVVGELKIPGYSTYIHEMDDDHLLTIGVSENWDTKLSVFDVSDFSDPQEVANFTIRGSSEAQYEHKAFTFFKEKGLLAIPVNSGYRYNSKLQVFKVSTNDIAKIGSISMDDIGETEKRDFGWWNAQALVKRSIFADDYVYAISNLGVKSALVDDIPDTLATVKYDCDMLCYGGWYNWWN